MDEQGAKADKDDVGESWVYEAYRDVKNTDFHVFTPSDRREGGKTLSAAHSTQALINSNFRRVNASGGSRPTHSARHQLHNRIYLHRRPYARGLAHFVNKVLQMAQHRHRAVLPLAVIHALFAHGELHRVRVRAVVHAQRRQRVAAARAGCLRKCKRGHDVAGALHELACGDSSVLHGAVPRGPVASCHERSGGDGGRCGKSEVLDCVSYSDELTVNVG